MGRRRKQKNPLDYISIPSLNLSSDIKQSIWAVFFLTLGIICFLSIFGLAGSLGVYLNKIMEWLSGWGHWLIPVLLILAGWELYQSRDSRTAGLRYFGMFLFLWSFQGMLQLFVDVENWEQALEMGKGGGHIGWSLAVIVIKLFGFWAGIIVVLGLIIVGLMLMFNTNLATLFRSGTMPARLLARPFSAIFSRKKDSALAREYDEKVEQDEGPEEVIEGEVDDSFSLRSVKDDLAKLKNTGRAKPEEDKMSWKPTNIKIDIPFDLLNSRPSKPTSGDIKSNIEIIKTTLEKFNIPVEMGDVSVGPTVTQYTLKPAEGIKLSRITGLNNDLSMALAAHPVRIEAPIPGKALVGIEVPNRTVAIVNLREVLESEDFKRRNNNLMIALGKIYTFTQRIDEATAQFNRAIEINPNNVETHFQLGLVYNQLKRYEESAMEFRKVIQLSPGNTMAYYNLACALSMLNKTDDAFSQLELSIQKGFNQYENIQKDTDLENLKLQKEKWNQVMKKYFPDQIKD